MSNCDAALSAGVIPGVPGRRGLMLGDILGNSAGETCTEPVDLFLFDRGASWGVFRADGPAEPGANWGLALADAGPEALGNTGDGNG